MGTVHLGKTEAKVYEGWGQARNSDKYDIRSRESTAATLYLYD